MEKVRIVQHYRCFDGRILCGQQLSRRDATGVEEGVTCKLCLARLKINKATLYQPVSLEEAIRQARERELNNIFRASGKLEEVVKALQDEIDEQARASLVIAEEEE